MLTFHWVDDLIDNFPVSRRLKIMGIKDANAEKCRDWRCSGMIRCLESKQDSSRRVASPSRSIGNELLEPG
jgi:hypothetical protein